LRPRGRLRHATGVRLFRGAGVRVTRGHKVIAGNLEARHDPTIADQRRRVRRTVPADVVDVQMPIASWWDRGAFP
jgi:hypothetical protein